MPLRSRHFSGDKRLEACLVQDSAHVLLGDSGPYVLKIQQAVVNLSGRAIPIEELEQQRYGPGTAAAVLSYKRAHSIINFAYQTTADDVVGKMTIRALDDGMVAFETQVATIPPPLAVPHPKSPATRAAFSGTGAQSESMSPRPNAPMAFAPGGDAWEPPVSGWPDDLKATLARSNALRTKANKYLAPIIPWGDDRKTLKELSTLLAGSSDTAKIQEIYRRMRPFGIWHHIAAIREVYAGSGSRGFFADVFNHDAFLRDMKWLTRYRNILEMQRKWARFCQDIFNVHGPRDTFREVVLFGPGLHICITQRAERANPEFPCDIHVDAFQQGNLVECGHCIPLLDASTVAHVISVSPYLVKEANATATAAKEQAKEYLRKVGVKVPGL